MKAIVAFIVILYSSFAVGEPFGSPVKYANHIFNEIHSSARQFGSSLNHNGMAFFLANVPNGTEFYHGTGTSKPVKGMEWLAFEPEHALVFARAGSNRASDNGSDPIPSFGYLHTYRTKRPLRLMYLNGASAAKSVHGTFDTQDHVLLHRHALERKAQHNLTENEEEHIRASNLCRMAKEDWKGQIDGFMRMEAGFEVILCNFGENLDLVRMTQAKPSNRPAGAIADSHGYFKAIAARYDGIGGGKVTLDYDNYVSLFNHPGSVIFDRTGRPRVHRKNHEAVESVLEAVKSMVVQHEASTNWQAVTDMIVARYADKIDHLASARIKSLEGYQLEAERSLRPFIDYGQFDGSEEVSRCREHLIPYSHSENHAAAAILEVNTVICRTLSAIMRARSVSQALSLARTLKKWLAWAEWKKCKGCQSDEFCFIPLWPIGSAEDFESPRCISDVTKAGRDYWGTTQPKQELILDKTSHQRYGNATCSAAFPFGLKVQS